MLTGAVVAQPPAFGIAALDDWAKIPADYDAVGWTCKIDDQGRFRLEVGEMRPGLSQLRLKVCHTSGATTDFAFDYEVDSRGKPNVDVFRYRLPLDEAVAAYAAGDRAKVRALADELQRRFPDVPEVHRKASHLLSLLEAGPPRALSELPAKNGWVSITGARFRSASTGWGPPLRDQVPVEKPGQCFLQVGGKFFEQGLYAHAPSKHELELDGKWARFRSAYGLQDGHSGLGGLRGAWRRQGTVPLAAGQGSGVAKARCGCPGRQLAGVVGGRRRGWKQQRLGRVDLAAVAAVGQGASVAVRPGGSTRGKLPNPKRWECGGHRTANGFCRALRPGCSGKPSARSWIRMERHARAGNRTVEPNELMELEPQAHFQAVAQDPFGQFARRKSAEDRSEDNFVHAAAHVVSRNKFSCVAIIVFVQITNLS